MTTKFKSLGRDVYTIDRTVAAAGNSQATATGLTAVTNVVTSATGTSADGLRLPTGWDVGDRLYVANTTAVALDVFPPTGQKINGGSDNAAVALKANAMGIFVAIGDDNWAATVDA